MTPARRAKIKALAEDERGDPKIRAVAQRMLKRHPEPPKPPRQQRVPGVERSPEYLKFVFMDLNQWKSNKGILYHVTSYEGKAYKFTIFKSKTGHWGWKRRADDAVATSLGFETRTEAHRDAWQSLQTII